MQQLPKFHGIQVKPKGRLIVPFGTDSDRNPTPINGEIRASATKGYGEIYVNGRWVLFGQDSMPLVPVKTGAYTQTGSAYVPIDTSGGSFTITLDPLSIPGDRIVFVDVNKTWYQNSFTLSSADPIEGASADLVVNSEDGALELLFVNKTEGWVVIDGTVATDESGFLGRVNITSNTTASPRYEYIISASAAVDVTLPADAPVGSMIRITDGYGAADISRIRAVAATSIINGNSDVYEIGNKYGSVTFQCLLVNGTKRWIVIQENAHNTPITRSEITADLTVGYREDVYYPVNTTSQEVRVTLPSNPRPRQVITFTDSRGNWHVNNFAVSFGAKGSLAFSAGSLTCIRRFGWVQCIFNESTDSWDVLSSEFETDVIGWESKTASFTAMPDMGYRLSSAGALVVTLTDPDGLNGDEVIRLLNVSSDAECRTNHIAVVPTQSGDLGDQPVYFSGRGAFEFRIAENGTDKFWYLAASTDAPGAFKDATTSFTAYGDYNYRTNFSASATVTLDTTERTQQGDVITIYDVNGSWRGKTIRFVPQTGTIDGWGDRKFDRGFARLSFVRTPDGYSLLSEEYADIRDISSPGTYPKPHEIFKTIHTWTRTAAASFTAQVGHGYAIHSRSHNAFTVTLPTPTSDMIGKQICVFDHGGEADRKVIQIVGNIGGGQNSVTIATSGGHYVFECRYQDTASTDTLVWMPVLTPDNPDLYLYAVDATSTPIPDSALPVNTAVTISLPTNAANGQRVKVFEHQYRIFKNKAVYVRSIGGQELMNSANTSFRIPQEVSSMEFIWMEGFNSWQIADVSLRVDTSTSKLDLTTNLTWVRHGPGGTITASPNHGYAMISGNMTSDRTINLPSNPEVGTIVAVSLEGENLSGRRVYIRGGSYIGGFTSSSYPPLDVGGSSINLVYVGSNRWVEAMRDVTHSRIKGLGSTPVLNFDSDTNTFTRTLTGTFTLTDANSRFPGNVCTTFIILLRQDGSGNRAINLPASWKKSSGSEDFSLAPNTYNLIQGTHIQGVTFYNVSVYA